MKLNNLAAIQVGLTFLLGALPAVVRAQDYDPEQAKRAVARVSLINGDVSVRHGEEDVVAAAMNAPLVADDRVYTGNYSRAELQFDAVNFLRMGGDSEVRVAQLEANRFGVQVARGTVHFSVLRDSGQKADVEIDTPSVAVRPVVPGAYRITVLEDGTTQITVRSGQAEVITPQGTQRLDPNRTMLVRGTGQEAEFQLISEIRQDEFDQWCQNRDREIQARNQEQYRYVPNDVYGAEDLSGNGQWVYEQPYGYVWSPNVADTWAPYRYGRWTWVDWYGWTWVSYDPWGWAPYHYGRWFHGSRGWCWYPGAVGHHQYWSPALVAFVGFGGGGVSVGVGFGWGNVGWVPLAPYEVYHPWWGAGYGHGYHNVTNVNVVNNINIYNNYRNARVANGITAVDAAKFGRVGSSQYVRVSGDEIRNAAVVRGPLPVTPARESLRTVDRDPSRTVRTNDNVRGFYSARPASSSTSSRVSFEQQRQNIQEFSRQAYGNSSGINSVPNRSSSDTRAVQPASAPQTRTPGDSWRRFGDPSGLSGRGSDRPASAQSNSGGGRFGEPSAFRDSNGAAGARTPAESSPNSSWRNDSPRGWGSSESLRLNPAIVRERPAEAPRSATPQSTVPSAQRYEAPRSETPRYSAPQAPRYSAPSSPAPRTSGTGWSGGGGASRGSTGGGGGHSAPSGGSHASGGTSRSSGGSRK